MSGYEGDSLSDWLKEYPTSRYDDDGEEYFAQDAEAGEDVEPTIEQMRESMKPQSQRMQEQLAALDEAVKAVEGGKS